MNQLKAFAYLLEQESVCPQYKRVIRGKTANVR